MGLAVFYATVFALSNLALALVLLGQAEDLKELVAYLFRKPGSDKK